MAQIKYSEPKIATWTDTLQYESKEEKADRTEVVTSAQILSVNPVVKDGSLAYDVLIEISFGGADHSTHCIVAKKDFESYGNDEDLLKALVKTEFNIE